VSICVRQVYLGPRDAKKTSGEKHEQVPQRNNKGMKQKQTPD
jgi:hypothetical protein